MSILDRNIVNNTNDNINRFQEVFDKTARSIARKIRHKINGKQGHFDLSDISYVDYLISIESGEIKRSQYISFYNISKDYISTKIKYFWIHSTPGMNITDNITISYKFIRIQPNDPVWDNLNEDISR